MEGKNRNSILKEQKFLDLMLYYCYKYKKRFITLLLVTIFQSLLMITFSIAFGILVNEIVYHQDINSFLWEALLIGIIVIIYIFFEFVNTAAFWNTQLRFVLDLRMAIMKQVFHAKSDFLSNMHAADVVRSVNLDTPEFMNIITDNIFEPINALVSCVIVFCILYYMNPIIAIFVLLTIPIMFLISRRQGKLTKALSDDLRCKEGLLNSWVYQIVAGLDDIRINNGKKGSSIYFKEKNEQIYSLKKNIEIRKFAVEKLNSFISILSTSVLFLLGVVLNRKGHISLGDFVTCISLMNYLAGKVIQLNNFYVLLQARKASLGRVYKYMTMQGEQDEIRNQELAIDNLEIRFNEVSFKYENRYILKNVNFSINTGERIAIVGRNGSGKSTILKLIDSFYTPCQGKVFISDQDISLCTYQTIRKNIALMQQEIVIFTDTIRNNLCLNKRIEENKLWSVCNKVGLSEFIKSLPLGLETIIGTNGFDMSGGQKQRLYIARTLLKEAPILLLDEAFSALDNEIEEVIEKEIFKNDKYKIIVVISHNQKTIEKADKVIFIENSSIIGVETHNSLLESNELYQRLFEEEYRSYGETNLSSQ
mgnify:CR=1 FL=1